MDVNWDTVEKEKSKKLNEFPNAIVLGKTKLIYQLKEGHFVFWDCYPGDLNAFGLKEEHFQEFIQDAIDIIKKNKRKLLDVTTYCEDDIRNISKMPKIDQEKDCSNNDNIEENQKKPYQIKLKVQKHPQFYFYNLKNGKRDSGIKCFTSDVFKFIRTINDQCKAYDVPVLQKTGIKRKCTNDFF
jgi:hypothetical protein